MAAASAFGKGSLVISAEDVEIELTSRFFFF